jgi:hypothetical protein
MTLLSEAISWSRISLPAGAAVGQIGLSIGEVGTGDPVGLVTAGIHGDEGPWGAWAIHKMLEQVSLEELQGTLRVVPVANPFAMQAEARNSPFDELDLNRVFPGNAKGSHTERLAAALVTNAVEGVDVAIDLHGGGSWCVNAFAFQFPGGEALSRAFGAPFIASGRDRSATLTGYARSQGATVTALEMGGRSEDEEIWATRIASGLRRALGVAGVLTPISDKPEIESIAVGESEVLRPSRGGIFVPAVRTQAVGTIVEGGTVLGHLVDPVSSSVIETFKAPFPQTALLLLRPTMTRIEGGAMTYVVAEPIG